MKWSILLPIAVTVACSRAGTGSAGLGDEEASTVRYVARISAESPPRWPEEYPSRVVRLPMGGGTAMTAGDEPSSEHPAGTVYVLEWIGGKQTISEWDLISGKALRQRELPFDCGEWPRLLHRQGGLDLAASNSDGMYYTRLDQSFRVIARRRLEKLNRNSAALASDGTLAFVVGVVPSYDGAPGGVDAYAATFDARGTPIVGRELGYGPDALGGSTVLGDIAAVAAGSPYIVTFDAGGLRLHQLTRDLREVINTIVPARPSAIKNLVALWVHGDRLIVDVPPEQQFEYSFDLTELHEVPRRPPRAPRYLEGRGECRQSVAVGPTYALLCDPDSSATERAPFIAWDHMER